jgi:hypothetical protein
VGVFRVDKKLLTGPGLLRIYVYGYGYRRTWHKSLYGTYTQRAVQYRISGSQPVIAPGPVRLKLGLEITGLLSSR